MNNDSGAVDSVINRASPTDEPPDVFLSYSRRDRARAEELAGYLESVGIRAFWDPEIDPDTEFEKVILKQIERSAVVLVCWSASAVASDWVKREAAVARDQQKYLAITFDGQIPRGDPMQIVSLRNWYGGLHSRALDALARAILCRLGRDVSAGATPSPVDEVAEVRRFAMLWTTLGCGAAYYGLSMWIATRTSGSSSLGMLIDQRPTEGSLIALFVVGVLTFASSCFLNMYAKRHRDEPWNGRIPTSSYIRQHVRSSSSKFRAALLLGLGHVLPLASLVHFWRTICVEGVLVRCGAPGPEQLAISWWSVPRLSELSGHHYCFGRSLNDAAKHGITFIPLLEPLLLVVLLAVTFAFGFAAIWTVFRWRISK